MAKEDKLPQYYTQFPFQGKRYVIYCRKKDESVLIQIFSTCYAAKHFINLVLRGEEVIRERTCELWTNSEIHIKCSYLEEILDHEFTSLEAEWELPQQYQSAIYFFKHRRFLSVERKEETVPVAKPVSKPQRQKKKAQDGMVTASMIAEDLGVVPRLIRVALRSAKIEKPEGGWAWPENEAIKITHTIKKYIK